MVKLTVSSNQEAFNKAYVSVRRQGQRCMMVRPDGQGADKCSYSNSEGMSCGIGHLVKFEDRVDLPNNSITDLISSKWIEVDSSISVSMLQDIQLAHDRCEIANRFVADFHERMGEVAAKFMLSRSVMDNYTHE